MVGAYQPAEVAAYVSEARRLGLSDIHYIGKVLPEDLARYYRTATVFVAPSTGSESFGIVLLEAMAAGVPIVASDITGYRSVLSQHQEGLLVEPGNELAIAGAITSLLEDPQMRSRMAKNGQRTAQQYDWKVVAPSIFDYYCDLIKARSRRQRELMREGVALNAQLRPAPVACRTT